ncbi:glycosyltransferase family A protein [Leisingera thetidis]|uniref:glycosyltransferase family A protein n=1 Tax=Leisingera thetidis TaxID=2930199 RepID=UPI0021F76C9D|nr:glycosyltransferase family A protein [Leisingera thetidis]
MTALPELTVAVSTIGARVLQLAPEQLPPAPGVRFLIVLQLPEPVPEAEAAALAAHLQRLAARPGIAVLRLEGSRGAARSRNAAMAAAETPLLLFADDDQGFDPAGWQQLRQLFAARPQLDFLCARLRTPEGGWRKPYGPERIRPVRRLNCLKLGTPEMALRLAPVRAAGVQFDPRFGAGGPWPAGDEFIFASDCLAAGLRGCHVPVSLGDHPADSSGMALDRAALAVRVALFRRAFGAWAPLLRLVFALRHRRRIGAWRSGLDFVLNRRLRR